MTSIYRITPSMLEEDVLHTHIYPNLEQEFYWDDTWDAALYVGLARAGFIAITHQEKELTLLLPQIQASYAVLDWEDVHYSRNLRRLLRSRRLDEEEIEVRVVESVDDVLDRLTSYHEDTWLTPAYRELIRALPTGDDPRFAIHAIELWSGKRGELVSGELGYTIGATYTSLTGFCNRLDPTLRHFGTLQMIVLAQVLHDHGYAFWNMGHPNLAYKHAIGAHVLERNAFLERWLPARDALPNQLLGVASGVTLRSGRHNSP